MSQVLSHAGLRVGGLTSLTTIDFPSHLAAVIFIQGCPWRCRYCHNLPLLDPFGETSIQWLDVMDFLARRREFLDGVVFSGGEPTLWEELPEHINQVAELDYKVALHTNGAFPERLQRLLDEGLLDWVALDIKAPFDSYGKICGDCAGGEFVRKSAEILIQSGIPCEFRTTVHPDLLSIDDVLTIARVISGMGVRRYVIQKCRLEYCLDPALRKTSVDIDRYFIDLKEEFQKQFSSIEMR
jgi:pyruvate formate lyase activating enzyme